MTCPVCGAHSAGQIGRERYYCGECCHEWVEKEHNIEVFNITPDGKLYTLKLYRLHPVYLGISKAIS